MKEFVAGFDPGGQGNFGWCLAELTDPLNVICQGTKNCADEAFDEIKKRLNDTNGRILAAGIDAPLYWTRQGDSRESDVCVRRISGASSGTVQAVNSLRGACLIQGFFLATRIESEYPDCMITETHPKALVAVSSEARKIVEIVEGVWNEHEADALISAWVAAQCLRHGGKQNLFECDKKENIHTFLKKTMYWWPN